MFLPHLKLFLHPFLPRPVHVHCLVSTPHIHDTAMHRPPNPLNLSDSLLLLAWIRETLQVRRRLLSKTEQFGNFSSRCFLMNSPFHVWESTSLFCSRSMTAGVSLCETTLVILALHSQYSTPRDSLQEWKAALKAPALSQRGSSSSQWRGCVWRDPFAFPVEVDSTLTPVLTLETLRFPGPTLVEAGPLQQPSLLNCLLQNHWIYLARNLQCKHASLRVHSTAIVVFYSLISVVYLCSAIFGRLFGNHVSRNMRCRQACFAVARCFLSGGQLSWLRKDIPYIPRRSFY